MATLDAIRRKEQERIAANTAAFVANSKETPIGNAVYDSSGNLRAEKAAEFERADRWIKKYNQVISGASKFQKSWDGRYSKDITGGYLSDIQNLIDDYDQVKKAVGVQSPQFLKQLRSIQKIQSQMDSDRARFDSDSQYNTAVWGSEYSGKSYEDVLSDLGSGKLDGDKRDWLQRYMETDKDFLSTLSSKQLGEIMAGVSGRIGKTSGVLSVPVNGFDSSSMEHGFEAMRSSNQEKEDLAERLKALEWAKRVAERREKIGAEYGGYYDSPLFEATAQTGASRKNPTMQEVWEYNQRRMNGEATNGQTVTVQNPLEYYLSNWEKAGDSTDDTTILRGKAGHWEMLADKDFQKERQMYNYLLQARGADAANQYLNDIGLLIDKAASEAQTKRTKAQYDSATGLGKTALNVASIPANVFGGAVNAAGQAISAVRGEFNPYIGGELAQFGREVRENTAADIVDSIGEEHPIWGQIAANTYQGIMSGADSAMGAALMGNGYMAMMGSGAASQRALELYESGASGVQIGLGAVASGLIEVATEKYSIEKFTERFLKGNISGFTDWAKKTLLQGLNEGSEEIASELLNMVMDALAMGANSGNQQEIREMMLSGMSRGEAEKQAFLNRALDVFWAGYGGLVSGGAMGGIGGAINDARNSKAYMEAGRAVLKAGTREALAEQAGDSRLSRKVAKDAAKGKDGLLATRRAGRLYTQSINQQVENIQNAERKVVRSAVEAELDSRGIRDESGVIANMLEKSAFGEALSGTEGRLYQSMNGGEILQAVAQNENVMQSVEKATEQNRKQLRQTAKLTVDTKELAKMVDADSLNVSTEGKTLVTGTDGSTTETAVKGVKAVGGKLMIALEDGSTAKNSQISYADSGEAALYTVASSMNIPEASANALIQAAPADRAAKERYAFGVQEMYRYGALGIPMGAVSNPVFASSLTAAQRQAAYNLGKNAYQKANAAAAEGLKKKTTAKRGEGRVTFDGNEKSLSDLQRGSLKALRLVAKALKVNIDVFQSETRDGKHIGENGSYDPNTGTIRIDISAGADGKGTTLFTLAHELTHFMKEWSPAKYQTFSEFLLDNYAEKGVPADLLVQRQMEKAKRNGRTISRETALEEVIADSCEQMLSDGRAIERLEELRQTDRTVFEKVVDFIHDIAEKVKELYKGLQPDSLEARYVAQMQDAFEQLQELWAAGVADAAGNFENAQAPGQEHRQDGSWSFKPADDDLFRNPENDTFAASEEKKEQTSRSSSESEWLPDNSETPIEQVYDPFASFDQVSSMEKAEEHEEKADTQQETETEKSLDREKIDRWLSEYYNTEYLSEEERKEAQAEEEAKFKEKYNLAFWEGRAEPETDSGSEKENPQPVTNSMFDEEKWNAEIDRRLNEARSALIGGSLKEKAEDVHGAGIFENAEVAAASADSGIKYSIREIVGESGKNYGVGVYLDSTRFTNAKNNDERTSIAKNYISSMGNRIFTAYDESGKPVKIKIANGTKFRNSKGKKVAANRDLKLSLDQHVKQEAIVLVNELIAASSFDKYEEAKHTHDWLDNDGKNPWDVWDIMMQEKNNSVWAATLKVANTTNGEKILYAISNIKKVEGPGTSGTTATNNNVPQANESVKHSFRGENAADHDQTALDAAKQMRSDGADSETIRKETGWFVGADGKWRFEISDKNMTLKTNTPPVYTTLGNLISHEQLFRSYPDMKDVSVWFESMGTTSGQYDRSFDGISINQNLRKDPEKLLNTLTHEIQHAIQYREGFTRGASTEYWKRRIDSGYDSRTASQRAEAKEAAEKLDALKNNNPELYESVRRLEENVPTVPRGKIDWDTLEQIEDDPPEWQAFDAERDRLEEQYGEEALFEAMSAFHDFQRVQKFPGRSPADLYYETAGEIEARDSANRRTMDDSERKGRRPDTGHSEYRVFADEQVDIRFSDRETYAEQVEQVRNNTHDANNHVYMGTTPTGIAKVLELPKLPMLVTAQHIYSMAVSEQTAQQEGRYKSRTNYHDLGWDTVKRLPEYINKPAMLIKANTDKEDARFVVVTEAKDRKGTPIIAAIQPNGRAYHFNLEMPSNFMLSSYGKDSFAKYIRTAKNENRILYVQKNSQTIKNIPGVQFADNIFASDYRHNLAEFQKNVKKKFAGTIFENNGLPKFSDRDNAAKENAKLRADVANLKELLKLQGTTTGGTVFQKKSLTSAANFILKESGRSMDADSRETLAGMLAEAYAVLGSQNVTYDDIVSQCSRIAQWVDENGEVKEVLDGYAESVLNEMKGIPITLDDVQKEEVKHLFGSVGAFRSRIAGTYKLAKDGVPLDTVWNGLTIDHPMYFDGNASSADLPRLLVEAIDRLRNTTDYEVSHPVGVDDISVAVYDGFWKAKKLTTVADRYQAKLDAVMKKHDAAMKEVKADRAAAVADIRKQWDEEAAAMEKNFQYELTEQEKSLTAEYTEKMHNAEQTHRKEVEELHRQWDEEAEAIRASMKYDAEEEMKRVLHEHAEGRKAAVENRKRTEYRQQIRKMAAKFHKMATEPGKSDSAHAPVRLVQAVARFCDIFAESEQHALKMAEYNLTGRELKMAFDNDRLGASKGRQLEAEAIQRVRERNGRKAEAIAAMQKAYAEIQGDGAMGIFHDEFVQGLLDKLSKELSGTDIYEMNTDQLKQVYNTMQAMMHTIVNANKLFSMGKDKELISTAKKLGSEIDQVKVNHNEWLVKLRRYLQWQMAPDTFFSYICGFIKDNEGKAVQKAFSDGTERMLGVQRDFYQMFRHLTEAEDRATSRFVRRMMADPMKTMVSWGLKDAQGNEVKTTRGMMLQAYMLLNQQDSFDSLIYGGFKLPRTEDYYKGRIDAAYGDAEEGRLLSGAVGEEISALTKEIKDLYAMLEEGVGVQEAEDIERRISEKRKQGEQLIMGAEAQLIDLRNAIAAKLTVTDRDLIATAAKWYKHTGQLMTEVYTQMYGYKPNLVKGYVPIHRDLTTVKVDIRTPADAFNLENSGFTKERVHSTAPILLTDFFEELNRQQNQISRYYGFAQVQKDFNRIWNLKMPGARTSINAKISAKYGTGKTMFGVSGESYINNYIQAVSGANSSEDILSSFYGNAASATLSLNPRVALSQLASIPTASAVVGWKNMAVGFAKGVGTSLSRDGRTRLMNDSVWFYQRYRGAGGSTEFSDLQTKGTLWGKAAASPVGKALFNWCQAMDVFATASMWSMAEEQVSTTTKLAKGSEAYREAVQQCYADIIRKSQPNYTVTERSDMLRDKRGGMKLLNMYKTQSNQNLNILVSAAGEFSRMTADLKAKRNGVTQSDVEAARKKLANGITSVTLGGTLTFVLLRMLVNFVMGKVDPYRDEETDEVTMQAVMAAAAKEAGSSVAGMFTLGGQLYDFVYSAVSGERYYGISDSAISSITSTIENLNTVLSNTINPDKDVTWKQIEKALKSTLELCGVPAGNAQTFIKGAQMWYRDLTGGTFGQFTSGETSKAQYQARLLQAYRQGDSEKCGSIVALMAAGSDALSDSRTEKEMVSEMKTHLKKQYTEGTVTEQEATGILKQYFGMTDSELKPLMMQWNGIAETGRTLEQTKDAYFEKKVSSTEYVNYLVKYSGKSREDAQSAEKKLRCERDEGVIYSDIDKLIQDGKLSHEKAVRLMTEYGGESAENAEKHVTKQEWKREIPGLNPYIGEDTIAKYTEYCERSGVPKTVFYDLWEWKKEHSKKAELVSYIAGLRISDAQRSALWKAFRGSNWKAVSGYGWTN